ncbi:MAG: ribosome-associated translation inhibitor RaiA [Candidatus Adiutrix sp.]|jgi:putative sigma-54 modulation protein|nr:ribosome-associated translation inhibitor RaiA [Candidatus Adiutrix sp.]
MQYSVTFRHMEPSDNLKDYSHDKLLRLEKYLDAVIDAEVTMTVDKFRHRAEVLITSDGLKIKAEEETEDMYSAIDAVVDKLEKQIKRHREKLKDHKAGAGKRSLRADAAGAAPSKEEDDDHLPIDRRQTVTPPKMTVEEAGAELATGQSPQVIFINRENSRVSILHQIQGGQLELVTIEA